MTAPAGQQALTLHGALLRALEQARQTVAADASGSFQMDSPSTVEIATQVDLIASAIRAELVGAPLPDLGRNHLARRILQALRADFLGELAAREELPESRELIRTLEAFEVVGRALEGDWRHRFTDRLSGPDGLELVVEVAHDLRSPLTSILFLAETLRRGRSGPLLPLQERQIGLMYAAAFGLTSVASDVIELARGGERQLETEPLPFAVGDILESLRDIVQPIAEEKGLEVRLEGLGEGLRSGYPVALSRVLLNLTTNALKFTDEGSVQVSAREVGATGVEFSVRDTGRGIPPQALAMLFEPFRRRQSVGGYAFSGSGLGLSICRKLVEAMRSELRVEAAQGGGTRFSFTLDLPRAGPSEPS
ncbi:MAG TPA: HAMP domain-containing sensor histidine kinase [Gemmatimonadales bacterium]|nr:HAMP domain-containing sensor histidine kinase [Gemmatimonadales bacterium]